MENKVSIDIDAAMKEPDLYFDAMGAPLPEGYVENAGLPFALSLSLDYFVTFSKIIKDDPQSLLSLMGVGTMDDDELEHIALRGIEETGSPLFKEGDICEVVGKTREELRRIVFPALAYVNCSEPGCPHGYEGQPEMIEMQARNKAEYTEIVTKGTLGGKSIVCSGCWERYRVDIERAEEARLKEDEDRKERYEADAKRRADEQDRLLTMPYKEYLQTDHWKRVRSAALKRAAYRCQVCNSDLLLQVHHRSYQKRGQERASDVTVLCRRCHADFHRVDERGEIAS